MLALKLVCRGLIVAYQQKICLRPLQLRFSGSGVSPSKAYERVTNTKSKLIKVEEISCGDTFIKALLIPYSLVTSWLLRDNQDLYYSLQKEGTSAATGCKKYLLSLVEHDLQNQQLNEQQSNQQENNFEIQRELNGCIVPQRAVDSYINLTKLCAAGGKKLAHWNESKSTKAYLVELSSDIGIPISSTDGSKALIVYTNARGEQSTWGHPEVAVDVAKWVSIPFRIQVNRWFVEWSSGKLNQESSPQPNQQTNQLQQQPQKQEVPGLRTQMADALDLISKGMREQDRRLDAVIRSQDELKNELESEVEKTKTQSEVTQAKFTEIESKIESLEKARDKPLEKVVEKIYVEKRVSSAKEIQGCLQEGINEAASRVNNIKEIEWLMPLLQEKIDNCQKHNERRAEMGIPELKVPEITAAEVNRRFKDGVASLVHLKVSQEKCHQIMTSLGWKLTEKPITKSTDRKYYWVYLK